MDDNEKWDKLPSELLLVIAHKLSSCQDYKRFSAVSKSWKSILSQLSQDEKPLLPPESPLLFLAEQVAEGAILSPELKEEHEHLDEDDDDEFEKILCQELERYDYRKTSVGSTRCLYSLSTRKTYDIELPEASGKLILGTNKGWLFTLGIDLQINLLHPLLRKQIPLPPMNTFSIQHREFSPQEALHMFIRKVVMSSKVQPKKNAVFDNGTPDPMVMAIYGECKYLAFAKLGDKVWTNVNVPVPCFEDIAYYKGKFYAVDCVGAVFVCDIGDGYDRGGKTGATKIALGPLEHAGDYDTWYLVESGSDLWLVLRIRKYRFIKGRTRYRTIDFSLWKLEFKYLDDSPETPLCTSIRMNSLGDEALFIGRASSVSLHSSKYIKPNSIYFTDDLMEAYNRKGGGHDMGMFNMESGIIEPFFEGKSLHPISPPLWYI